MRNIVLNLAVTLDGYIEGPNGEIDWCSFDIDPVGASGAESFFDTFLESIDTIFYGRVSYDMWGQFQPEEGASAPEKKLWSSVHSKKKFVFTRQANKNDDRVTLITSNVAERVDEIRRQPGKDIWLYGGGSLITTFINLNLIDRYLLAIHPVVLGAGKPLFSDLTNRVSLKLNKTTYSNSGVILADYNSVK
jgi:dihydrofolate reductase